MLPRDEPAGEAASPIGAAATRRIASAASMDEGLRPVIDQAIERHEWSRALALLERLFRESPTIAGARLVLDRMRRIADPRPRARMRLAILRSFTIEPVVPLLQAAALLRALELEVWTGGFNTYAQELLDPTGALGSFEPDAILLAVQTRDLVPALWDGFSDLQPGGAGTVIEDTIERLTGWLSAFRSRSNALVVIQGLELPDAPVQGVLDAQLRDGQAKSIREVNSRLGKLASELGGMYVLDYDGLVARHGRRRWHDERKWLTARMPIAADCLPHLAEEYLRMLLPLSGRVAKTLVVDLDNTLWGGVVGEDGKDGIEVGPEYPGAAYLALQRAIISLQRRGVLIAVASKNNESEAIEALDNHPAILLRSRDFAALRINWNDKASSLREIAAELNIGVDSLAFLDDSPVERERIRIELPAVMVVELPADPMLYAQALADCPFFERLSLTDEDLWRGRLYAEQRERKQLERSSTSVESFLQSLEMQIDMSPAPPAVLTRVAQLTQKTNQFNLTTRRYSEPEIQMLAADPCARVYQASVRDRFGDNGLVGVAIVRLAGEAWEIDTLLLSCRVISRGVETAMLAHLAADARSDGATRLRGWFVPTRKNAPCAEFYPSHGFTMTRGGDGATRWELDIEAHAPDCPAWIASCT